MANVRNGSNIITMIDLMAILNDSITLCMIHLRTTIFFGNFDCLNLNDLHYLYSGASSSISHTLSVTWELLLYDEFPCCILSLIYFSYAY